MLNEAFPMSPGHFDPAPAQSALGLDRKQISDMLVAMGVDLTHPLAPSFILGSFDVMAAADLADRLPSYSNFEGALQGLHTMRFLQPAAVREVQFTVLESLCTSVLSIDEARRAAILARLESITPTLN